MDSNHGVAKANLGELLVPFTGDTEVICKGCISDVRVQYSIFERAGYYVLDEQGTRGLKWREAHEKGQRLEVVVIGGEPADRGTEIVATVEFGVVRYRVRDLVDYRDRDFECPSIILRKAKGDATHYAPRVLDGHEFKRLECLQEVIGGVAHLLKGESGSFSPCCLWFKPVIVPPLPMGSIVLVPWKIVGYTQDELGRTLCDLELVDASGKILEDDSYQNIEVLPEHLHPVSLEELRELYNNKK